MIPVSMVRAGAIGMVLLALGGCEYLPGSAKMGKILAENNCGVCHDLTAEMRSRRAPPMWGIYNRPAGAVKDFNYSAEFLELARAQPFIWDDSHLDRFITDPAQVVPGTRMAQKDAAHILAFEGMKDAVNRRDIKAFLKTLQ